jgi:hypothetical protein
MYENEFLVGRHIMIKCAVSKPDDTSTSGVRLHIRMMLTTHHSLIHGYAYRADMHATTNPVNTSNSLTRRGDVRRAFPAPFLSILYTPHFCPLPICEVWVLECFTGSGPVCRVVTQQL